METTRTLSEVPEIPRGHALLDLVIVVDSLDAFMLTGLKLGSPGCSPPKFFFFLVSRARFSPYPTAHRFCHFFFPNVFHDLFTFSLRKSYLAGHGRCLITLFAMLLWPKLCLTEMSMWATAAIDL